MNHPAQMADNKHCIKCMSVSSGSSSSSSSGSGGGSNGGGSGGSSSTPPFPILYGMGKLIVLPSHSFI